MAPPHKRRRISYSASEEVSAVNVADLAPTPTFSHGIEHLPHAHTAAGHRKVPQRIEEVHLQIHEQAIAAPDSQQKLHRRQQGTAVSSQQTLGLTVIASVGSDGGTTALSTASDGALGISSYASTATTTVISSPSPSSTGSESSLTSSSETSAGSDLASSTLSDNSTESATSTISDNSTESATESATASSTDSSSSINSSTQYGFIDISPAGTATSTTASGSGSNGSVTLTGSAATFTTGSISRNSTTSAVIIIGSDTTYTSQTTIDLASQTTRSGSRSSSSASASRSIDLGLNLYIATLSNGDVTTVSRSSLPYETTFSGGQVSTISPVSVRPTSTGTNSDGLTSTYYSTFTPTDSADSNGQSTITSYAGGSAGQQGSATSSATSSTSSAAGGGGGGGSTTPPAGTIAGGVVGGAAGLAVVVLIAMLFFRWYRRKAQTGHQALPHNTGVSPDLDPPEGASVSRGGPGMAERAGLMPVLGAVPALFRHQNRSQEESTEPSERGFTRVSGRKLPSSFSPGMSSPPPTMPLTGPENNLSSTSFYRDSAGFYGGSGGGGSAGSPTSPTAPVAPAADDREEMTLSPGPQRRPTVHAGGPYVMSPSTTESTPASPRNLGVGSPTSPAGTHGTAATFDRSDTPSSLDPNRSSRFTEEV